MPQIVLELSSTCGCHTCGCRVSHHGERLSRAARALASAGRSASRSRDDDREEPGDVAHLGNPSRLRIVPLPVHCRPGGPSVACPELHSGQDLDRPYCSRSGDNIQRHACERHASSGSADPGPSERAPERRAGVDVHRRRSVSPPPSFLRSNVYAFETCVYGSVNGRVSGPGFEFTGVGAGHLGRLQGCPPARRVDVVSQTTAHERRGHEADGGCARRRRRHSEGAG